MQAAPSHGASEATPGVGWLCETPAGCSIVLGKKGADMVVEECTYLAREFKIKK